MSELVYLSQPSRLGGAGQEDYQQYVIEDLTKKGVNVIHPFEAFPYERFEGNPAVGRELAIRYCCELIDACKGGVALTGISEGTLIEAGYLLDNHPSRNLRLYPEYDPLWEQEIDKYNEDSRFAALIGKIAILNTE